MKRKRAIVKPAAPAARSGGPASWSQAFRRWPEELRAIVERHRDVNQIEQRRTVDRIVSECRNHHISTLLTVEEKRAIEDFIRQKSLPNG
jgi:CBS-domain-containing membrane protein